MNRKQNTGIRMTSHQNLQQQLHERLQQLNPTHLDIINESLGHGGYFPGKESHFKVVLVSPDFEGQRLVKRHQRVYALAAELINPAHIHALAIHAYTPTEWQGQAPASPACAHAPMRPKHFKLEQINGCAFNG